MPRARSTSELPRAAHAALDEGWGLRGASVRCLRDYWNAVFRVRSHGRSYLLRVHSPRYHDAPGIASELEWMLALGRDTALPVATPIAHRGGGLVARLALPDLGPRDCTLLSWVEGRRLSRAGVRSYAKIGAIMATLHAHAATWRRPRAFSRPSWDAAALARYWFQPHDDRAWHGLSRARRALFRSTLDRLARVEHQLAEHHPEAFGLIHADLHRGNLIATPRGLAPIDFDDCAFGCHLYDLAVPLAQDQHGARSAHAQALVAGYRTVRALDPSLVDRLDVFVAARAVAVALFLRGWATEDERFRARVEPATDAMEGFVRAL